MKIIHYKSREKRLARGNLGRIIDLAFLEVTSGGGSTPTNKTIQAYNTARQQAIDLGVYVKDTPNDLTKYIEESIKWKA